MRLIHVVLSTMQIRIIGNPSGAGSDDVFVDEAAIERLLQADAVLLSHQGEFTGKPETRIYADALQVLKINTSRKFQSQAMAEKWCGLQLVKEIDYQLYHPARVWLTINMDDGWRTANVTPRLNPLHRIDFSKLQASECIAMLGKVMECYIGFACRFNLRLDEGLSNFAIHAQHIVYLDDDIYGWDNFTSFSAMLANWLRKSAELSLDVDAWRQLGRHLKPLLSQYSSEADDMVCAGVEDQIVGKYEPMKQAFMYALRPTYAPAIGKTGSEIFDQHEPIGLLADVHANLPAFEAVLAALDGRGIRQYLMLGDVVGYGPNPKACIDLIRQRNIYCLRGNHDHYVAHQGDVRVAMGMMAKRMADWTIKQLDMSDRAWLGELPVRYRSTDWMAVHGAPVDKSFFNAYVYEMTAERNLDHLAASDIHICLHGHSHIQGVYGLKGGSQMSFRCPEQVDLKGLDAALLCPGSIGQTRGGTASAQAAVFYPDTLNVEMLSLNYNIEPLIADMLRLDFPAELIARLREGR